MADKLKIFKIKLEDYQWLKDNKDKTYPDNRLWLPKDKPQAEQKEYTWYAVDGREDVIAISTAVNVQVDLDSALAGKVSTTGGGEEKGFGWSLTTDGFKLTSTVESGGTKTYTPVFTVDNTGKTTIAGNVYISGYVLNKDAITHVEVQYALSDSSSTAPTGGWSPTAPAWESGKYMWQRTYNVYADGEKIISAETCIQGAKGDDGTSVEIKGNVAKYSDLPVVGVATGDGYIVDDASDDPEIGTKEKEGILYTYNAEAETRKWTYCGKIKGPKGDPGSKGDRGDPGSNGYNNATLQLYKRAATASIDWTNDITYVFSSKEWSAPTGWSKTVPDQTTENKNPVWSTVATASSNTTTDTIKPNEWTSPIKLVENGSQGIPGPQGEPGTSSYTWIKYADSLIEGKEYPAEMYDTPKATTNYIGTRVSSSPTESSTPSDYKWSKFKGDQGIPGGQGPDGKSLYTWIKYTNDKDTEDDSKIFDSPTDPSGAAYKYIAMLYNKESQTESSKAIDYKGHWSAYIGEDGENAINTAQIYLYQRATSQPSKPSYTGNLIYTFTTASLDTVPTGWTLNTIPSGTNPCYVTHATAAAQGETDEIPASEWSDVELFIKNGENGKDGTSAPKIVSVIPWYYLSTSETETTGGKWDYKPQEYQENHYYWYKEVTTYDDETTTESEAVLHRGLNGSYSLAQGKSTTTYSQNAPTNPKEGDCWFKQSTTESGKGELKQWTGSAWENIGDEIVVNKVTATYINAFDITAKKIDIIQGDKHLFTADGTAATPTVKIANFNVNDSALTYGEDDEKVFFGKESIIETLDSETSAETLPIFDPVSLSYNNYYQSVDGFSVGEIDRGEYHGSGLISNAGSEAEAIAMTRLVFTVPNIWTNVEMSIKFAQSSKAHYDYGVIGKLDSTLSTTYKAHGTDTNEKANLYIADESSQEAEGYTQVKTVTYNNISTGVEHFIDIKYQCDRVVGIAGDEVLLINTITFTGEAANPTTYCLYAGADDSESAPIKITSTGKITATKAEITGSIMADAGRIAAFNITNKGLESGVAYTSDYVHIGTDKIALGNTFSVDKAGKLTSTSGTIGGITIQSDRLQTSVSNPKVVLRSTVSPQSTDPNDRYYLVAKSAMISSDFRLGYNSYSDANYSLVSNLDGIQVAKEWQDEGGRQSENYNCVNYYNLNKIPYIADFPDLTNTLASAPIIRCGQLEISRATSKNYREFGITNVLSITATAKIPSSGSTLPTVCVNWNDDTKTIVFSTATSATASYIIIGYNDGTTE